MIMGGRKCEGSVTRRGAVLGLMAQGAALPGARFRVYSRCLPEYLAGLAAEAQRRREAALTKLTSAEAIRRMQTPGILGRPVS